jgi:hypothetical protein
VGFVSGTVQNQNGIIDLRAEHIEALQVSAAVPSHDFLKCRSTSEFFLLITLGGISLGLG